MAELWLSPPAPEDASYLTLVAPRHLGTQALEHRKAGLLQVSAAGILFPGLLRHTRTFPSLPARPGQGRDHI